MKYWYGIFMVVALSVTAQAQPLKNILFNVDTCKTATDADTTSFAAYNGGEYYCPPFTVFIKHKELSDSTDCTVVWQYSNDTTNIGWISFDSINFTVSTGTGTETRYWVDTLLVPNITALFYRCISRSDAGEDKGSGTEITYAVSAAACPRRR